MNYLTAFVLLLDITNNNDCNNKPASQPKDGKYNLKQILKHDS